MKIPDRHGLLIVPAVSQNSGHGVVALLQQRGNIMRHVQNTFIEMRIPRVQIIRSDPLAIDE
jgi:hypothetical protein